MEHGNTYLPEDTHRKQRRFSTIGGVIVGLLLGAGVIIGGFAWVNSLWNHEQQVSEAEWGRPYSSPITSRGPLQALDDYGQPVRQATVYSSPTSLPISVMMYQADSEHPTTAVWHNSRTGELFTVGDYQHEFDESEPPRIQDHALLLAAFLAGGLLIFFSCWIAGASRQKQHS